MRCDILGGIAQIAQSTWHTQYRTVVSHASHGMSSSHAGRSASKPGSLGKPADLVKEAFDKLYVTNSAGWLIAQSNSNINNNILESRASKAEVKGPQTSLVKRQYEQSQVVAHHIAYHRRVQQGYFDSSSFPCFGKRDSAQKGLLILAFH